MKEENLSRADKKRVKKEIKESAILIKKFNDLEGKQRKKNTKNFIICTLSIFVVLLALDHIFGISEKYANIMNAISIIISVGIIIGLIAMVGYYYNLFTGKISAFFHHHKKAILLCTISFGFCLITYFCLFPEIILSRFVNMESFEKGVETLFPPTELFGFYTAQLSLTFISISVMSVLSDKSVMIYWSNVSEDRLIEPTFSCFAAFTYYSIAATLGAGLGVLLRESLLFIVFFALNVLSLVALTLSITDVYYSRDTKKKKLAAKLCKIYNNAYSPGYHLEKYNRTMLSFAKNISHAAQNGDLLYLREAYELVVTQMECFEDPNRYRTDEVENTKGREVIETLLSTLNDTTFPIFAQAMDKTIEVQRAAVTRYKLELEEFEFMEGVDIATERTLKPDSLLWEVLSENEYFLRRLSKCPEIDREFTKQSRLFKWIADRMQLDYQRNMLLYRASFSDENLSYEDPDWETTEKIMEFALFKANFQDERLFVSFAKLLCAAFEDEKIAETFIFMFDKPPYVYYLLDRIEFFEVQDNLREQMNRIFRKHHPDETLRQKK